MAVLEFDIYAEDAPNGTLLGTITDEDATDLEFEVHMRKTGTGRIVIPVDSAKADLVRPDRYVKCRVPVIDTDPLFGFWLREGHIDLSSKNERGALRLNLGGPGARDVLRLGRLLEGTYAPVPPASDERGSSTIPGLWRWIAQHRGAIAARAMEEGINQVIGTLLPPMDGVTFDWDRTNDSGGVPWTDPIEVLEQRVGIDIDSFIAMLEEAGGFILEAEPNLLFHAWQTFPSRDLSASVIFQAAGVNPNVASEMARSLNSTDRMNATILETLTDGLYHTNSTGTGVRAHIGYLNAPIDTSDYAEMISERAMEASEAGINTVAVEVDPTQFLPGKSGTSGDFWVGDFVGLKTQDGTGDWDYNGEPQLVTGIRVGIRSATDDSTTDRATRSLKITALLNDDEAGRGHAGGIAVGITHGHPEGLCDPFVEGTTGVTELYNLNWEGGADVQETVAVYPSGTDGWPVNNLAVDDGAPGDPLGDGSAFVGWGGGFNTGASSPILPATAGVTYRWAGQIISTCPGDGTVGLKVLFYNVASGTISSHQIATIVPPADTWAAFSTDIVAPTGTVSMSMVPDGIGACSAFYDKIVVSSVAESVAEENPYNGVSLKAARCDHTHPAEEHEHDADYSPLGHSHIQFLYNTGGGEDVVDDHGTVGATETITPADGNWHTLTLDANLTLTLGAPTSGVGCSFVLELIQDGSGGHTLTLPASVANKTALEAAYDTTADTTSFLILLTRNGGTTWYGFFAGNQGSAVAALDDLTDVTITSPTTADRLRFDGSEWVNSSLKWVPVTTYDGTNWLPAVDGSGNAIMTEA